MTRKDQEKYHTIPLFFLLCNAIEDWRIKLCQCYCENKYLLNYASFFYLVGKPSKLRSCAFGKIRNNSTRYYIAII